MIVEKAQADAKRILNNLWKVSLTFQNRDKSQTAIITGAASSHRISIDPDTRMPVNANNTQVTICEQDLIDEGYTVRNAAGEVDLRRHYVKYTDSTGFEKTYTVDETWPDQTIGLIVCILGLYE